MLNNILIAMAGQDENFISQTVESCLDNAIFPDNINFSIVDQRSDGNFAKLPENKNIIVNQILTMPRGVGYGRSLSIPKKIKEKYVLSIDPHMVFSPGWDKELLDRYIEVKNKFNQDVVVSQHLPWSTIVDNKLVIHEDVVPGEAYSLFFNGIFVDAKPIPKNLDYVEQEALCGYYLFSGRSVFEEVRFDPRLFYFSEESVLSLRLISRGHKLVSLNYNPMFHLEKVLTKSDSDWRNRIKIESVKRDIKIFYETFSGEYFGEWGAKDLDSLENFKNKNGISMDLLLSKINYSEEFGDKKEFLLGTIDGIFNNTDVWTAIYDIVLNTIKNNER
jgi:hypothetical protein